MSKFKIRESYLLLLIVLGLVSLGIYTTYALFTASTAINDVVGITATLDIGKSLTEYEVITVPSGETKLIELNVVNSYNGNIYYGAWYQIVKGNSSDIDIGLYTEKNSNPGSGLLSASSNINLLVGVTNNSTSSITLYIGVKGSLTNELNLGNNKILIPDGFIEEYKIIVNVINGTINNSTTSTIKVKKGNDAIFNVTPNDGYQLNIDTQTCNGTLNSEGVFTISNITGMKECNLTLRKSINLVDYIITTYTSNDSVDTRTDFSSSFTEVNDKIYTTNKTEDGSTVYYYAGNTTHNWIKFGKYTSTKKVYRGYLTSTSFAFGDFSSLSECTSSDYKYNCAEYTYWNEGDDIYWRIIRTNEDNGVRLLYSGNSPSTVGAYIAISKSFNNYSGPSGPSGGNVGYIYYNYYLKANADSVAKQEIDKWYLENIYDIYDKYVSRTAIYCNDRSIGGYSWDNTYGGNTQISEYGAYTRFVKQGTINPSYKCGVNKNDEIIDSSQITSDKLSASTTNGGNGLLNCSSDTTKKCPIVLMTADEVVFAGNKYDQANTSVWYYLNSLNNPIVENTNWWTISPYQKYGSYDRMFLVAGNVDNGILAYVPANYMYAIRPALSLKSCVKYSSGDGTPTNPYTVTIDDDCASKEN